MKKRLCAVVLRFCAFLDHLPPANRQYGCEMGISQWAADHLWD